jgi:hypothetical protein
VNPKLFEELLIELSCGFERWSSAKGILRRSSGADSEKLR